MKKIFNLLFTVCAFSLLTFTTAYAASTETPESAGMGQVADDSVDCIAINGGSGQGSSATSEQEDGTSGNGVTR